MSFAESFILQLVLLIVAKYVFFYLETFRCKQVIFV